MGTQGRKRLTGLEPWERRVSKHFTALGPAEQTDRGQGTEVERRTGESPVCAGWVQAGVGVPPSHPTRGGSTVFVLLL